MSTQVSECPLVQIPKPENRPRAKFHPNIWGDLFITYTPEDEVIQRKYVSRLMASQCVNW